LPIDGVVELPTAGVVEFPSGWADADQSYGAGGRLPRRPRRIAMIAEALFMAPHRHEIVFNPQ